MDTDDLSHMAYQCLIVSSGRICRDLMVWIGAFSGNYPTEDDYLRGVLGLVREILKDPDEFLEENCFDEEIDSSGLTASLEKLVENVYKVLLTPIETRGDRF